VAMSRRLAARKCYFKFGLVVREKRGRFVAINQ